MTRFVRWALAPLMVGMSLSFALALDAPLVIPASDFFLAKVTIGASLSEVHSAFGQPKQSEAGPVKAPCKVSIAEDYGGVKAIFCDGRLVHLSCFTKGYKTPTGVEVGMSQAEAIKKQGNTAVRDSGGGSVARYQASSPDKYLLVHFRQGKVSEIELWSGQA